VQQPTLHSYTCPLPAADSMTQPFIVQFNPVAFGLGPIQVHWYGLMYLLGFLVVAVLGEYRRRRGRLPVSRDALGDLFFYGMMGVIIGGRLWYMLFYYAGGIHWIWTEPLALFRVWDGGMSFHGGLLGVLAAAWWWSRRHRLHFFDTMDFVAPLVPIGLGLGRLGNFINGELWGKPTALAWGMIFQMRAPMIWRMSKAIRPGCPRCSNLAVCRVTLRNCTKWPSKEPSCLW
jgi:phosphatidylglycerol:prolipoprotein diacylglycerol transferase